jgi:ABC-type amino acid transport substrate-binding protein
MAALKPIPRLILIVLVVGGGIYGGMKFMDSRGPQTVAVTPTTGSDPAAPTITVAQPGKPAPAAAASAGRTYQDIVDKGAVRVSVQSPAKPFYYVENGKPQGFNYDFLKVLFAQGEFTQKHPQIAIDTDHPVDTYPDVPAALLKTDNRGNPQVDIAIDGLTFSDEDLPGVVYSIPYVDDFGYALIAPKSLTLRSIDDINGMTIGILKGDPDVKGYATRQFPKAKFVELSDESINGERSWINNFIKKGQVDAIIYDYPFGVAEIRGTDLQFAVSKLPGSDIKYKIGVRKGDSQLLENINVAIRKAKALPEYSDLLRKYFTSANLGKVKTAEKTETVYVVKAGDTLSKIAAAQLGSNMRFGEIETRNNLPNPNLIQPGQKLVIPKA